MKKQIQPIAPPAFKIVWIGNVIAERTTLRQAIRTGKKNARKIGHDVTVAHVTSAASWTVTPLGAVNLNR